MRSAIAWRVLVLITAAWMTDASAATSVQQKFSIIESIDSVPALTLRELVRDARFILVGRIQSLETKVVEDSREKYTEVLVAVEDKSLFLKGAYKSHLSYRSSYPSLGSRGDEVLLFLGPEKEGLATPIGIDRGEFLIKRLPEHHAVLLHSSNLWTESDPLWALAPRSRVADELSKGSSGVQRDVTEVKVKELLSIGDRPKAPQDVPLDLVLIVIRLSDKPSQSAD